MSGISTSTSCHTSIWNKIIFCGRAVFFVTTAKKFVSANKNIPAYEMYIAGISLVYCSSIMANVSSLPRIGASFPVQSARLPMKK